MSSDRQTERIYQLCPASIKTGALLHKMHAARCSAHHTPQLVRNLLVEPVHDKLDLARVSNGDVSEVVTQLHDNLGAVGAVGAPVGQAALASVRATLVRVEGLGEVGPVGGHLLTDIIVDVGEGVGVGVGVESVQGVHDLGLVEGTLGLARGSVGPVVGVEVGLGGLVPVGGVGPGADEGGVTGGGVPGTVGGGGVVVGRVELDVAVEEVTVLQGSVVEVFVDGVVGGGGGAGLVLGVTGDDGDVVGRAVDEGLEVGGGKDVVVQDGLEDQGVACGESSNPPDPGVVDTVLRADEEVLHGELTQLGDAGDVVLAHVGFTVGNGGRHVDVGSGQTGEQGVVGVADTRLGDSTVEVAGEERAVDGVVDLGRTEGLTSDGHTVRVTTEVGDVLLDPLENLQLIQDTIVARSVVAGGSKTLSVELGEGEVAEGIVTAVEGDEDNILHGHTTTVPPGIITGLVGTLVPNNDRELGVGRGSIGPEVQAEAVLADISLVVAGTRRAERGGVQCLVPGLTGLGRLPAVLVASVGSEGDTQESGDIGLGGAEVLLENSLVGEVLEALNRTVVCLDNLIPKLGLGDSSAQGHRGEALGSERGHAGECKKSGMEG